MNYVIFLVKIDEKAMQLLSSIFSLMFFKNRGQRGFLTIFFFSKSDGLRRSILILIFKRQHGLLLFWKFIFLENLKKRQIKSHHRFFLKKKENKTWKSDVQNHTISAIFFTRENLPANSIQSTTRSMYHPIIRLEFCSIYVLIYVFNHNYIFSIIS